MFPVISFTSKPSSIILESQSESLTNSHLHAHFDAYAADGFWERRDKMRNCPSQAVSSFALRFLVDSILLLLFIELYFYNILSKSSAADLLYVKGFKKD